LAYKLTTYFSILDSVLSMNTHDVFVNPLTVRLEDLSVLKISSSSYLAIAGHNSSFISKFALFMSPIKVEHVAFEESQIIQVTGGTLGGGHRKGIVGSMLGNSSDVLSRVLGSAFGLSSITAPIMNSFAAFLTRDQGSSDSRAIKPSTAFQDNLHVKPTSPLYKKRPATFFASTSPHNASSQSIGRNKKWGYPLYFNEKSVSILHSH
jgi:hypothetical protein